MPCAPSATRPRRQARWRPWSTWWPTLARSCAEPRCRRSAGRSTRPARWWPRSATRRRGGAWPCCPTGSASSSPARMTEFSKQTGDYPSLSAADLQVLALTYQLHVEHVGAAHLRTEPLRQVTLSTTNQHPEAPVHLAGFYLPSKTKPPKREESPSLGASQGHLSPAGADEEAAAFGSFMFWRPPLPNIEEDLQELLKAAGSSVEPGEPQEQESAEEDEEGWITPSNIRADAGQGAELPDVQVACLTTDFAMQNVLLQMGLQVLAVNGLLIQHARSHILRCHGCFRTTSDMTRLFCPHCGNKTLKKVAVTTDSGGNLHMHFSRNPKVLNPRGLRHSLPAPQGGKHAHNPHLVDDQRFPQQRLSRKAKQKTNVFDPDYLAGMSPFAENDIYSRAANLQIRDGALGAGRRRMNPNTSTKKCMKKR
ncbi:RNA-binding protein NOB1 isoform X1 [Sphaerodactylus townsendi]|uniref:RNA-binding protein NOB1 isoform X1 n=1 Tax=Sphaerodactylus townsendi TaxID=933632 RepID=UPI0020263852|nr:RNA-binding protein NOB1 isoform X1 [Sphaerodactylus townsendi]